jgi:hypothetical protein
MPITREGAGHQNIILSQGAAAVSPCRSMRPKGSTAEPVAAMATFAKRLRIPAYIPTQHDVPDVVYAGIALPFFCAAAARATPHQQQVINLAE